MRLLALEVSGVRNIKHIQLDPLAQTNLFYGDNGAGKTSILEAIYFIGMARSFRSPRIKPFINYESDLCRVVARVLDSNQKEHRVGIERAKRGGFTIRYDGQTLQSAAQLARILPLQLLNADTYKLLDGGPKERRQLIDWGVFHVEHSFMPLWQRAKKAIKQRNTLLRSKQSVVELKRQLAPWNIEIARASAEINSLRKRYIERFAPVFENYIGNLLELDAELVLGFDEGWGQAISNGTEAELLQALEQGFDRDIKSGLTHIGPHRADLSITIDKMRASDLLSRGQQKLVVSALKLAQCRLFAEELGRPSLLLADDIPSEVDNLHQEKLFRLLQAQGMQLFLTSIAKEAPIDLSRDTAMFHVKHGRCE